MTEAKLRGIRAYVVGLHPGVLGVILGHASAVRVSVTQVIHDVPVGGPGGPLVPRTALGAVLGDALGYWCI